MTLNLFASQPHYAAHALAVWAGLEPHERGRLVAGSHTAWQYLDRRGWTPETKWRRRLDVDDTGTWLVAGYRDVENTSPHPVVYLEHGAGQTYGGQPGHPAGRHAHYAGGYGRDRVVLFLVPNWRTAELEAAVHPDTPVAIVGCPRLDAVAARRAGRTPCETPTIGVTFHHPAKGVRQPEAGWAWPEYADVVSNTITDTIGAGTATWVGHSHPLAVDRLADWWAVQHCPWWDDVDDVLEVADLWVVDNSSTLYEAAALDIPCVALNSSTWRRDVHHGLRFWDSVPGVQVDEPADFFDALREARSDDEPWPTVRRSVAADVYGIPVGAAVGVAVHAIRRHLQP